MTDSSSVQKQKKTRLYYMDAMRSVLMSLGVVLHAAAVFRIEGWAIKNPETHIYFDWLNAFIHAFRMPACFIISGFFCHLTLTRYGASQFLKVRLQRIIVPMLSAAIVLNLYQYDLLAVYHQLSERLIDKAGTAGFWFNGEWVYHLWFLGCLVIYFIVASLIYLFMSRIFKSISGFSETMVSRSGGLYLMALPFLTLGMDIAGSVGIKVFGDGTFSAALYETLHFGSFFAFGFFLGANKHLVDDFSSFRFWPLPVIIAAVYFHLGIAEPSGIGEKLIFKYTGALIPWLLCVYVFYFFKRFFNKVSTLFAYLADASYSIYLFHQLFVILLGIWVIPMSLNIWLKFLIVMCGAGAAALIIHHFAILKFKPLRYLFNGKTA